MQIALLHLTDIHFTVKTQLGPKLKSLEQTLSNDLYGIQNLYVIISGDIANSGNENEYKLAKTFLGSVKLLITMKYPDMIIKYILVPGNHDCNLEKHDNFLRKNIVQNLNYSTFGSDNSVLNLLLNVQEDFWNFYKNYNPLPDDKLIYQIKDIIDGKTICFHCINTAYMSQRNEVVGGMFFPVKLYNNYNINNNFINIGIWHHPYNWFNPNLSENNKKEFEKFTENISSIHFLGHEHEQEFYTTENRNSGERIYLISGQIFNNDRNINDSGFQIIKIDIKSREAILKKYSWKIDFYDSQSEREFSLDREIVRSFTLKEEFKNFIDEIKIPLVIANKKDLKLSDVYIYPDLENISAEINNLDTYLDSSRLSNKEYKTCVIDGENQIGKTSLLNSIYKDLYDRDLFPVLLNGKDIKELELDKIVRKAFIKQYQLGDREYERFKQLDKEKKAILIDDYQESELNQSTTKRLFDEALQKFGKVIVTLDSANSILPTMQSEFKNVTFYTIKPFGYKKRNDLIEKYHGLKSNPYTVDEQLLLNEIKVSFDNVQNVLGDKLIPSYPIYILSILQALEYKPMKQNETSYGYCYHTLIHYSLHKAGVHNDDIDSYFNFLTELAYFFIINDKAEISNGELTDFFADYKRRYLVQSYDVVLSILRKSKIIQEDKTLIKFGYDYILYYLSAKKISDELHTPSGKDIINKLFNEVHIEKNANILVFVTHHSKDISFIEKSLINSMLILDHVTPITLEKNDAYYDSILEIATELSNEVLETNRNPREERERNLKQIDKQEREVQKSKADQSDEEFNEAERASLPFKQSFRSIEIIGQIIRNRKGSLEIPQLTEMVNEVFIMGFRTVGYISELLISTKEMITRSINEDINYDTTKYEIENKINKFIQMTSLHACIGVFIKLTQAMGHKDLKSIYSNVANQINSPAAKLVAFSINSYYNTITVEEVKSLYDEFKGNVVATQILKARVKSYVYSRNVDYKTKQKFASCLGLTLAAKQFKQQYN